MDCPSSYWRLSRLGESDDPGIYSLENDTLTTPAPDFDDDDAAFEMAAASKSSRGVTPLCPFRTGENVIDFYGYRVVSTMVRDSYSR